MKQLETIPEDLTGSIAEFDTMLDNGQSFTVAGPAELIQELHVEDSERIRSAQTHKLTASIGKRLVEAPSEPTEPILPTYQPMTAKTRIKDWLSDAQWRKVDRELGLTGTDLSIVRERQERRLANRILVARIAAGVEKPPVWGKHKTALRLAERALQEA